MLQLLRIRHLALIDELEISFAAGMHVMTGETGAGKSIVVDAVNLVLGGRADRELIRTGETKAWVEAVFDIQQQPNTVQLLRREELEAADTVTLYREINQNGRSICRVDGVTMPLTFLRELAETLMDVHGQHEHRFLSDPVKQLAFLDGAGDADHADLLRRTGEACTAFLECHRRYARLVRENKEKVSRVAELERSLKELEKARFKPDEEESLQQERDRYRMGEKLVTALVGANAGLNGGDEGFSALSMAKQAVDALRPLSDLPDYAELFTRAESAYFEMEEVGFDLAARLSDLEFDPRRRDQVEQRLDLIRRMERKYGSTLADVLAAQQAMQEELDHYQSMDDDVESLGKEHKRLLLAYRRLAEELTARREALAKRFSSGMMEQLHDLGMEKTVFAVEFAEKVEERRRMPKPEGDDAISFLISPNPGEPLKPLAKIASGGELSRVMLALKSLEAEHQGVGTMVFDEIDTGISGRMAQVVGEKMAAIAHTHQVICVTHLPQIAAMAAHEYLVRKSVTNDRTNTDVLLLDDEARVAEIARLLGGADGSASVSAVEHARHMLAEAKAKREAMDKA